jgi:hypothetical protein
MAGGQPTQIAPDHPLVKALLTQPAVRALVKEAVGPAARALRAVALDQIDQASSFQHWQQAANSAADGEPSRGLTLRWHLDLIGPADGGLRVQLGSHLKGRLTVEEIAVLALKSPAIELAVSAGTVLAMRPLLVHGARRRTTRGHRRILHVEIAAGEVLPPRRWAWAPEA